MATKCPKCQTENPDTSLFCSDCGTKLDAAREFSLLQTQTLESSLGELATGSTFAGRYQVIEELGKGGMGKVYKVLDTSINERIALKLLKPEIAADQDTIERFSNELKFARKIRHKNVCQMFDLGKTEGTPFITMEYVAGEDLKSMIRMSKRLSIGTAVDIAKQICEGLGEAHALGVIHRDLKPSNIMIDKEGNARIMDFGIARSLAGKGITEAGVIIGTPEYMSPEQVEGKEADQRSDVYSLGVILYQMVTGRVPFEGDTPLSVAVKQKTEAPHNPRTINPQVPEDLSRAILRCLEKEQGKRYQTAEEVLSDLENIEKGIPTAERIFPKKERLTSREITVKFRLRRFLIPALVSLALIAAGIVLWRFLPKKEAAPTASAKRSIAVLPFEDLSQAKNNEYLCDGISETLINALTNIEGLWVPARTSAFFFKGKTQDIREIGQKLGVDNVLEGSVQVAGDNLRVTARISNIQDGRQLWSDIYNRKLESIFTIQDDIAQEIVKALKIRLLGEKQEKIVRRYTENMEAYNLYLKGRYFQNKRTEEDLNKAIDFFEQAILKDSRYALAYSGLADSYSLLPWYGLYMPKDYMTKARAAALQALELDSMLGEAHMSLAAVQHWYDWDWLAAEKEYKRGLELNPRYPTGRMWYGIFLEDMRRYDESTAEFKQAIELDPLAIIINTNFADHLYFTRHYDDAIEQYTKTLELDPEFQSTHRWLGRAFLQKGIFDKAIEEFQKTGDPLLAYAYTASGKRNEGLRILEAWERKSSQKLVRPLQISLVYLGVDRTDLAFKAIEKALQDRDPSLFDFIKDPLWDNLRSDPRFQALLKKMNLE